ncbi:hypothetical protein [Cohnella terricola]|uniref:Uncharacterized protein n=1 Tax=Cohnella terricola TaxID=1289167 RepID=A0A559JXJ4_9BACL|nr:hypothetical protein [Cohnella terricola]TVY04540.1 hypothetical protein FPZ45_02900 [Cohnella terricola]
MKIGTFVIGGLAGAAIVMMIRRNQRMSAAATNLGHNLKQRVNSMKDDAIGKAMGMKFASNFRGSGSDGHSEHSFSSHSSREGGLDEVKKLISQDPKVGAEVESILNENGRHHN